MTNHRLRELATRTSNDITVELLWDPGQTDVLLRVCDARSGNAWELPVAGAEALVAYHHPFTYVG